ncbi:hypothetical protein ABD74_09810 [Brevibacillus laterosporus]|nr:hypothetical protein [Brevibacillus laterosporus]
MLQYGNLTTESGSLILPVISFIILLFIITITIIVINNHKKNTRKLNEIEKRISEIEKNIPK